MNLSILFLRMLTGVDMVKNAMELSQITTNETLPRSSNSTHQIVA